MNDISLAGGERHDLRTLERGVAVPNSFQFGIIMSSPVQADMQSVILPVLSGSSLQSLDVTNPQLQVAQVLVSGYTVTINSQPGRIDFVAQRDPSPTAPVGVDVSVEEVAAVMRATVLGAAKIVPTARLAIIATSVFPHDTFEESLAQIVANAPGFSPPAKVNDVDIRVNSRAPIPSERLIETNRNIRWQMVMQALVMVSPDGTPSTVPPQHAVILTVDINSVPETPLSQDEYALVYDGIFTQMTPIVSGNWTTL